MDNPYAKHPDKLLAVVWEEGRSAGRQEIQRELRRLHAALEQIERGRLGSCGECQRLGEQAKAVLDAS